MSTELILVPTILSAIAALSWFLSHLKLPGHNEAIIWLSNISNRFFKQEELKALGKRLESLAIPISAEVFTAIRFCLTVIPIILGGVFLFNHPFRGVVLLVLSPLIWRLPDHLLIYREKYRKEVLEQEFPHMVNQIRIFAKASDHYQALKIVPYTLRGPLKKEMELLSAELEMNDLKEALENFSNRCNFQQAKDFAQILLVAIRTGIDIDSILSNYAKVARRQRINKLKRWIKLQPILVSIIPALLLTAFMLLWILPLYSNIINRLSSINY